MAIRIDQELQTEIENGDVLFYQKVSGFTAALTKGSLHPEAIQEPHTGILVDAKHLGEGLHQLFLKAVTDLYFKEAHFTEQLFARQLSVVDHSLEKATENIRHLLFTKASVDILEQAITKSNEDAHHSKVNYSTMLKQIKEQMIDFDTDPYLEVDGTFVVVHPDAS